MKPNIDSNRISSLVPPQLPFSQGKKYSIKDGISVDNSQYDFREKMQNMHDKLKAASQIGNSFSGDYGNDPSSYKMLDGSQQLEQIQLEQDHSRNISQFMQSEKMFKQLSSKICCDPQQIFEKSHVSPQQNNLIYESKHQECESPQIELSENLTYSLKESAQNIPQLKPLLPALSSYNKKSESSDDSDSSQSHQKVKKNLQQQNDKKMSSRFSQLDQNSSIRGKLVSVTKNAKLGVSNSSILNNQSLFFKICNKLLKLLRLKKELNNFDKGIQILDNILKHQRDYATRYLQKSKQFIQLLKSRYNKRHINQLKQEDVNLIGDITSYYYPDQQNRLQQQQFSIFKNVRTKFIHLIEKVYTNLSDIIPLNLFMPTDLLIVLWDVIQIIFTYIFLVLYSIQVFFDQNEFSQDYMVQYFKLILGLVVFDILIKFNTSYFEKDQIVQSRTKIAVQYLTSHIFFTDIISLTAIFFKLKYKDGEVSHNPDHDFMIYFQNCLIFLLGNRLNEKRRRFDNIITLEENQKHFFRLYIQLFNVISVAHFTSIAWYMLGIYEERKGYQITWLSKAGILEYEYYEKYIYSIYWTVTTMTTVGYGDISATNSTEALFISIMMILFSCVFAYSINNIGFILQEIEKSSKKLNDNLSTIQRYLNRKNVDISLKSRVRHYLNFLEQESKNRDKKSEDKIISILSNKLRNELTEQINTRILNKFHLFSSNFSSNIMRKIVFIMEEVLVSPNEIIFQEDDTEDQSIYFIQNGIIEIYSNKITKKDGNNIVYQRLSTNQLFGEISFFSGLARKASARSVNLSTMYRIQRDKFIEIVQSNEEDFERLKMMQEQILFHSNLKCLYLQCYSCQQLGHLASTCPKTHKYFDKQFIVLKNTYSKFQDRKKDYERKKRVPNSHSILLLKENKRICNKLKENCRNNVNTQTQILFGFEDSDDDGATQNYDEDEQQMSLSSIEESSRSQLDKTTMSKVQSLNVPLKSQDNVMQKTVATKPQSSTIEQDLALDVFSKTHHIKSQTNLYDNATQYQNNSAYDDLILNNIPCKVEKQRLSQLEAITIPTSAKQLSALQQMFFPESNFNQNDTKKQNGIGQQNQGDEPYFSKTFIQELMNKHQSLQSIDVDVVSSQNNQFGSKKNLDLNINTVSIQGASQKDQRNYFQMSNNQFKRSKEIPEIESEGQSAYPQKQVKRHSFVPIQNTTTVDGLSMQSFNNMSVYEKSEKNDDIMIHNKQLSSKQIGPVEGMKKKLSSLKQVSSVQFQQQNSNLQSGKAQTGSIPERLMMLKTRQFVPEQEQEVINRLNQQIQQTKQQSEFEKVQVTCLDIFDKLKIFKKFFPHNNFDKVLKNIKNLQIKLKKQKKMTFNKRRRSNVMLKFDMTSNQIVSLTSNAKSMLDEQICYKPTYLSYGVSIRNNNMFPKALN